MKHAVTKNALTRTLPDHLDLLYHLAYSWYPSLPVSLTRHNDVDDIAMIFAARVLFRARHYDPSKGGVTNFITVVCNNHAKDMIEQAGRRPNVVSSIDEHVFLGPSVSRVPREPRFLRSVQEFHLNLPKDVFDFVEELLEGKYYRRHRSTRFQTVGAQLKTLVERSGLSVEAYMAVLAESMKCDVMNAEESSA